jgi:hypothetical protein
MSDTAEIRFGYEDNDFVSITLLGRLFPGSTDYWDGNQLVAIVTVRSGVFSGKIDSYLSTDDFVRFADQLRALNRTLTGSAVFETIESWIKLELEVDKLGWIRLSALLLDPIDRESRLEFSIGFDQTYLPPLLKQLQHVTTRFPVIGKR